MNFEKNFFRGLVPDSLTTVYTVPKNKISILTVIDVCNRSSTQGGLYLYIVPSGESASNSNVILYNYPIDPIDTPSGYGNVLQIKTWEVINSEDYTIQIYGTGSLTISLNGSERPLTNV